MNEVIGKRIIFCILLALLALVAFWCTRFTTKDYPLPKNQAGQSLQPDLVYSYKLIAQKPLASKDKPNVSESNTLAYDNLISTLNDLNNKNDWILGLSEGSRELFVLQSEKHGIKILGQIPEINTVRFSISDPRVAFPYLEQFLEKNQLSPNYEIRLPPSPRKGLINKEDSFSDSMLQWLGGKQDRSSIGSGVKIALLDSGVNKSHPFFDSASISEKNFLPSTDTKEKRNHGTAMASVMVGENSQFSGISPLSEILSYRVIDEDGSTDTHTVAHAIVDAVRAGANIINLSLGGEVGSDVLLQAVNFAHSQGVIVVAAVGNEGIGSINYPAAYDGVLGVSSIGKNGRVSVFSNYGKEVDISAPGVGVLTAWENEEYVSFTGTSVSTAIVTAAIASELSRQPGLSAREVEKLLFDYANESEKPGFDVLAGHGVLSLGRLENRSNQEYTDLAVVGFHFDEGSQFSGGTIPFEVMIQNQGNTWGNNIILEVDYPGGIKNFPIHNLARGELRSQKLYLQGSENRNGVSIGARLILPEGTRDLRTENNKRFSLFTDSF